MELIVTAKVGTIDRLEMEDIEDKFFEEVDDIDKYFFETKCIEPNVYTLSEFVDACNNEELDLADVWLTHVNVR